MTPVPIALAGLLAGAFTKRAPSGATPAQLEQADFQALLERAQRGELSSGREVVGADDLGLDASALERVGRALDLAEAAGASTAAVVVDGRVFEADVAGRELVGEVSPGSPLSVDRLIVADGLGGDAADGSGGWSGTGGLLDRLRRPA